MAADVPVNHPPVNPCCTVWKEKCLKLEAGRKHLRQAVQILNEQIDKIQLENVSLKKGYEEEQARAETEKEAKEKVLALRVSLENEISALKSEINSFKQKRSADAEDKKGEVKLFQDHVSKAEKEITQLKALLEKEKIKADSEKKNAEAQKKSATEAWKHVKVEKAKADEERKLANIEGKKAEEYRLQLEGLRKEVDEAKSKLVSEKLKFEEGGKKLEAEKNKVIKERKHADTEKAKAEEQRKLAEANGKKAMEEKSRTENLTQLLEVATRRIEELQKELFEKAKAEEERKNANIEREKAEEYRIQLEALRKEGDNRNAKLASEILKFEEANKRLEIEKHQVTKERKHADSEMAKVKELTELAETNRKLALEEKSRADELYCELEESRYKIEELQKQIQELRSSRKADEASPILPGKDINSEARKLKLVEKQLKLEKMRLKYAKHVAKLEKNCNSILQQELGHINLDFVQISRRLDALNKWFSSGIERREGLEKAGASANTQRPKLRRKFFDSKPFEMDAQNESELLKPSCMTMAASYPLKQALYCTVPFPPISGGNCIESISGIDSKSKSLHGGSCRKLLQSSAINSSSGSFSDSQLVGSQETGAFVSTSEKQVEENSDGQTTTGMSGEMAKMQGNENRAVVLENVARNPPCVGTSGGVNGKGRKRNMMLDAIESVELLSSEGKKLHMQMEEKLLVLHGMLNREIEKPKEEAKYVESILQGCSYGKHDRGRKKRKVAGDGRKTIQHLCRTGEPEKTTQIRHEIHDEANACRYACPSAINLLGTPKECIKGFSDSFRNDCETMAMVDKVENGDFMKLLDLDDSGDEECYRRAMEMPLSPTLPEIDISSAEIFHMDKFKAGDSFHGELSNEKEILVPSHSIDVNGAEISSKSLRCDVLGAYCDKPLHENDGLVNSFNILGNDNGCGNTVEAERTSNRQTGNFDVAEMSNIPCSSDEDPELSNFSSARILESADDHIPKFCVVFSNFNDCSSISRIFCATRTCLLCSLDTETKLMVQKVLDILKMDEKLLPKEKACAFFTWLLLNFSLFTSGKSGSYLDKDFFLCIDSFAGQINAVVADVESRSLFAGLCSLDELLGLIRDFLVNGRVMMHSDVSSGTLNDCDSRMNIFLDGLNINLSSKPASADQLVAGSIILASICAAVDCIEFICEASYNLLQIRKCDTANLLAILHVFAYVGGNKFFSLEEYSLTMTVLKAIIFFLEGGNSSVASASSCLSSLHGVRVNFHSGAKCPFDAVSVDVLISFLLEKLQNSALSVSIHQKPIELALSNSDVLCHKDNAKQSSNYDEACCALNVNCDASCSLRNCAMPSTHPNTVFSGTLCGLTDVLSLVELLASYVSWEWICGKIIPVLLEILERPMLDDFAVAVVILLGQLGRLGVAASGYEDKEVENLKCKLSGFLQRDTTISSSLPVQIAIVTSLLCILPLEFEDVIKSTSKLPEAASQSGCADLIRNWFSLLNKEQQTLSFSLLQSAGVVTR